MVHPIGMTIYSGWLADSLEYLTKPVLMGECESQELLTKTHWGAIFIAVKDIKSSWKVQQLPTDIL